MECDFSLVLDHRIMLHTFVKKEKEKQMKWPLSLPTIPHRPVLRARSSMPASIRSIAAIIAQDTIHSNRVHILIHAAGQ
jgi:hypothetical protein